MPQIKKWLYRLAMAASTVIMIIALIIIMLAFYEMINNASPNRGIVRIILDEFVLRWLPFFAAIVSSIGTFAGVVFSWRADRRHARELELRLKELEGQIGGQKSTPSILIPSGVEITVSKMTRAR